ncbi:MAG: pyridoxamine 5'-phosphate oxidase family protein [Oscillospiraceae bacterium]|jgi:general stress protein 26|nr:pyridoxamine 5'-phosphate oxidase family protein [Oscillospiraceae bacterium]
MSDKREIITKAEKIVAKSEDMVIAYVREDGYPRASTISMMKADGIKTIYTSTAMQALKTKRIQANPKVSLCFRDGWNNITLTGTVAVSQDNALRRALWQDWCIEHFPDGAEGERFCVFVFETEEATFWIDNEQESAVRDEL